MILKRFRTGSEFKWRHSRDDEAAAVAVGSWLLLDGVRKRELTAAAIAVVVVVVVVTSIRVVVVVAAAVVGSGRRWTSATFFSGSLSQIFARMNVAVIHSILFLLLLLLMMMITVDDMPIS